MDMDSWIGDARHEEKLEIAHNLLRKKMSYEDVADATGLSLEEVKQLAVDLQN